MKTGKKLPIDVSIKIKDASELSVGMLKDIAAVMKIKDIRMVGPDLSDNQRYPYSLVEYEVSREILDEVVAGIDPEEPDIDKFTTIYTRLKHAMVYDHRSIMHDTSDEIRYSNSQVNNCRNLINGLRNGTCVCAGYAETLRNALALVGIESRYIRGDVFDDPDKHGYHAWNLVTLKDKDGVKRRYLADLTWEDHTGPRILEEEETKNRYALRDFHTFSGDHKRTFSPGVRTEDRSYDRTALEASFKRALARIVNPRERYQEKLQRKQERARKEKEEKKARDREKEERLKKEIEEKRRAIEKAKAEEERKRLEEEKRRLEEEERKKQQLREMPKTLTADSLVALIYKNRALKNEIENIRKILKDKDIPEESKRKFTEKLNRLVGEANDRQDVISEATARILPEEKTALEEDEKKIADLESKRFKLELKKYDESKKKKETVKKKVKKTRIEKVTVFKEQEPKEIDPDPKYMTQERYEEIRSNLENAIANKRAVLFSSMAHKAGRGYFEQIERLEAELAELKPDSEVVIKSAREAEVKDLVSEFQNLRALTFSHRGNKIGEGIFKRLEETEARLRAYGIDPDLTETREKEVEYEEEVEEVVEKPGDTSKIDEEIATLTTEIVSLKDRAALRRGNIRVMEKEMQFEREREAYVEEIQEPEKKIIVEEIKQAVEIDEKAIEETEKLQKQERREQRIFGKTNESLALETERDLYANEKQHRMEYMAQRLFGNGYDGMAAPLRAAINVSTTISMAVRNLAYRIRHGESRYARELEVTKNLAPVKNEGPVDEPVVDGTKIKSRSAFDEVYKKEYKKNDKASLSTEAKRRDDEEEEMDK